MIERQDVIRCDNLRLITKGAKAGQSARCRMSYTTPNGIKSAIRDALHRGWKQLHERGTGRLCHLCPDCSRLTDGGRHAVLATPDATQAGAAR